MHQSEASIRDYYKVTLIMVEDGWNMPAKAIILTDLRYYLSRRLSLIFGNLNQDLLRNYLRLIIHEVLKMKPAKSVGQQNNASERISSLFIELLERQFPIDNIQQPLTLKGEQ